MSHVTMRELHERRLSLMSSDEREAFDIAYRRASLAARRRTGWQRRTTGCRTERAFRYRGDGLVVAVVPLDSLRTNTTNGQEPTDCQCTACAARCLASARQAGGGR